MNLQDKKRTHSPIKKRRLQYRKKMKNLNLSFIESPHSFKMTRQPSNLMMEEGIISPNRRREFSMNHSSSKAIISPIKSRKSFNYHGRKSMMRLPCASPIASPMEDREIPKIGNQIENKSKILRRKAFRLKSFKCERFFQNPFNETANPVQNQQKESDPQDLKLPLFNTSEDLRHIKSPQKQNKVPKKLKGYYRSVKDISSFLDRSGNLHEQIGSPSNTSTEDSIIQAFEKGFLKNATREVLNNKLRQIKEGNNTKEAIKDVLEFTVKSKKDQFIDELKLLEGRLGSPQKNRSFLKFPVARRTRDRSCHSPEYMTSDSPSKIKIHN